MAQLGHWGIPTTCTESKESVPKTYSVSQEEGRIQTCLVSGERSYKERCNGSLNPATAEPSTVVS